MLYISPTSIPNYTPSSPPKPTRRNRRRERPGSRTRNAQKLPSNSDVNHITYNPSPSPLLRQSFDAAWLRWKTLESSSVSSSSCSDSGSDSEESNAASYASYYNAPAFGEWEAGAWRGHENSISMTDEKRIFGGEENEIGAGMGMGLGNGNGLDLCPAMLDVVRFLWGDVDYTDP